MEKIDFLLTEFKDGRSDVMMEPLQPDLRPHIIIEFEHIDEILGKMRNVE